MLNGNRYHELTFNDVIKHDSFTKLRRACQCGMMIRRRTRMRRMYSGIAAHTAAATAVRFIVRMLL